MAQTSSIKLSTPIAVFIEMGNPFLEKGQDILVLDTNDIINISVGETVRKAEALGEEQYKTFVEERLVKCEKPITDILSKNKLPLFSRPSVKYPSRRKMQIATLKNDCNLFSHLYISCQSRDGDLDKFFTYENQATPPSLSQGCKIRLGTKADLLHSLPIEENPNRGESNCKCPCCPG